MYPVTDASPEIAEVVHNPRIALSGLGRFPTGVPMFEATRNKVLASSAADFSKTERKRRFYGCD